MGIVYEGTNQTTKKWGGRRTYGGRLVENIVQAIARDVLGEVILRAYHEHLDIVFHIHDETITESIFLLQAEDGKRYGTRYRVLGNVYRRQSQLYRHTAQTTPRSHGNDD